MNLMRHRDNRPRGIAFFASAAVLALCLEAVVAVRFQTYDPSASAGSETILDYCLWTGVWLVPFASVCFAKRLFEGRRFRFALSWLVGFLIPWLLLVYETYFPHTPPEGSYCTEIEQCFLFAIFVAIITGVINAADSLVERMLCKLGNGRLRFAARLPFVRQTTMQDSLPDALSSGLGTTTFRSSRGFPRRLSSNDVGGSFPATGSSKCNE